MSTRTPPPPVNPMIPSAGLSAWSTILLDALLAAGALEAEQIADMTAAQLAEIARAFVRSCAAGERFDAEVAVSAARRRREAQARWDAKKRAA